MGLLRHWIFDRYLPQNLKVRQESTRRNYDHAINDLAEMLGREPELSDLTDENLTALIVHLLRSRKLAETTANERAGRIKAFWTWAAKKRYVDQWPTFTFVPEPEKVPRAWREDELVRIFNACRMTHGDIGGVPAWRWWTCLHAWLWCTGERIGATLALTDEHLDLEHAVAIVPAEIRKGRRKPMVYTLWPDVVLMLAEILPPKMPRRSLVFPWPLDVATFYNRYRRMLKRASVPWRRGTGPHKMRVSHATWRHIGGDDATRALGHSDSATTRRSYLDPTICRPDERQLFRPW